MGKRLRTAEASATVGVPARTIRQWVYTGIHGTRLPNYGGDGWHITVDEDELQAMTVRYHQYKTISDALREAREQREADGYGVYLAWGGRWHRITPQQVSRNPQALLIALPGGQSLTLPIKEECHV